LNKFIPIRFSPAIKVQDKFYIGWREPQTGHIKVGLDMSNDTGDKIFVKTSNTWQQNDVVHGSLMVRPVFGKDTIITGLPVIESYSINVYPNPNNGSFLVRGQYDQLNVITVTGQQISYVTEDLGEDKKIILQAPPGLYIVQVRNGNARDTKKIFVR
jgi:hypothetical protein